MSEDQGKNLQDTLFGGGANSGAAQQGNEQAFVIDLPSDEESPNFAPIPAGTYDVRIDKVEPRVSPTSGNNYLALTLVVEGGTSNGRLLFTNLSLAETALFRVKQFLQAIGAASSGQVKLVPSELYGARLAVDVVIEPNINPTTQEESMRNQVKKYRARARATAPAASFAQQQGQGQQQPAQSQQQAQSTQPAALNGLFGSK